MSSNMNDDGADSVLKSIYIEEINKRMISLDYRLLSQKDIDLLTYLLENKVYFIHNKLNIYFDKLQKKTRMKNETEKIKLFLNLPDEKKIITYSGLKNKIVNLLQKHFCIIDKTPPTNPIQYNLNDLHPFKLKVKQDECIDLISKSPGGLILAPTGFGKSWIIAFCCKLFKDMKIDVVNPSLSVCDMLYDLIKRVTGEKVGRIGGGRNIQKRINVVTAKSLNKIETNPDVVFLDEVHSLVTESYFENLMKYRNARIFGFTASLEREDNLHNYAYALCGDVLMEMSYTEARKYKIISDVTVLWVKVYDIDSIDKGDIGFVEKKRDLIWTNNYRNKLIASIAKKFVDSGYQTLVLVETIEHCYNIKKYLPSFEMCYAGVGGDLHKISKKIKKLGLNFVPITSRKRLEITKKFENREIMGVIANGVWSLGVSFDSLNVLIRGSGSSSSIKSIQEPGRVCRLDDKTGKESAIVIDFIDLFDNTLLKRTKERFNVYKDLGLLQIKMDDFTVVKNFNDLIK